jgi:anti-sigma B factor antagonist
MPAGWSISDPPVARTHETGVSTMGEVIGTGAGRVGPAMFEVEVSWDADCTRVTPSGDLDLISAPYLQQVLDQLCRQGHPEIVLDLSGLKFLGAAGLTVFLRADAQLRADGGRLILTRPGRLVRRVLAITELDTVLTIQDDTARDLDHPSTNGIAELSPATDTAPYRHRRRRTSVPIISRVHTP